MTSNTFASVDRGQLLAALGPGLRVAILQVYKRDSCIGSTRIAIDLLRERGITDAYGLKVSCHIYNAAYVARHEQLGRLAETVEELEAWHQECGAYNVGIGIPDRDYGPGKWPGHLVAIVERRWLWDLSIDQAERPEHGIRFPTPVLIPLADAPGGPEPFLRGHMPVVGNWNGMLMRYEAFPQDKSFRESANWRADHAGHQRVFEALGVTRRVS